MCDSLEHWNVQSVMQCIDIHEITVAGHPLRASIMWYSCTEYKYLVHVELPVGSYWYCTVRRRLRKRTHGARGTTHHGVKSSEGIVNVYSADLVWYVPVNLCSSSVDTYPEV